MTQDNEGQKSANLSMPDILSMSPPIAERHWLRWLADQEPFEGQKAIDAEHFTLAIREWGLNIGTAGEEKSRANLEQRYAAFKATHLTADK